jgi:ABC-type Na+ efflux pump permease subunit
LPQVWVISWTSWIYRFAMLIWALWLAFALLGWLRWGWHCFSYQELWRPWKILKDKKAG